MTKPTRIDIDLTDGYDPHELAPELWTLLTKRNDPPRLFLTEADPVRLEMVDGEARMNVLTVDRLMQEVHRVARFVTWTKGGDLRVKVCPGPLVREMRAMPFNSIPLPRLRQLATAPLVADDSGKIVFKNGYDSGLGIYLWCSEEIPAVADTPTEEDVARALATVKEPLQDFPFVNDASFATAIAIMVTPFVRRLINGPTPLHLIEKATPGTGATLLTDVLLTPAVGKTVQRLMPPKSEHEWEYSLLAVLRSLPTAVVIDNARELTSPQLAKALTDDVMVGRIVGSSDAPGIPILCVWVGTGNNPTLHQEIARRAVRCRIDAGLEKPWLDRTYAIPNLKEWLPQHRTEMIWAVLTIIRSWFVAGQPKGERMLGMFESYSQVLGGILAHVGVSGFLDEEPAVAAEDLQTEAERWLIANWWSLYRGAPVVISNLLEIAKRVGSPVLELWGPEARPDTYDNRLGWFIRSIKDKTFNAPASPTGGPGAMVRVRRCDDDPVVRTTRYRLEVQE
jgi:hypothetical protein